MLPADLVCSLCYSKSTFLTLVLLIETDPFNSFHRKTGGRWKYRQGRLPLFSSTKSVGFLLRRGVKRACVSYIRREERLTCINALKLFSSFLHWLVPLVCGTLELIVIYRCEYFTVWSTFFNSLVFIISSLEESIKRSLKVLPQPYSLFYCLRVHEMLSSPHTQYINLVSLHKLC